jgi:hypothetical protein
MAFRTMSFEMAVLLIDSFEAIARECLVLRIEFEDGKLHCFGSFQVRIATASFDAILRG